MSDEELTPFLEWHPDNKEISKVEISENSHIKIEYKTYALEISVKLLLHITLISIFETLFYFLYISSLENNGIEWTINEFTNEIVKGCESMTYDQIQKINSVLEKYINMSTVVTEGNSQESLRIVYNNVILNHAWIYIGICSGLFFMVSTYIKCNHIKINWMHIIFENTAMVTMLGLYELVFFNTIIYPYQPISKDEIERNTLEKLNQMCGILNTEY